MCALRRGVIRRSLLIERCNSVYIGIYILMNFFLNKFENIKYIQWIYRCYRMEYISISFIVNSFPSFV